jgi:ABC-type dipeptide/oligopeptide/nickel transport system permease component
MDLIRKTVGGFVGFFAGSSMLKFIARRLFSASVVLLGVIFFSFAILKLMPGKPFEFVGMKTMPIEVQRALNARFGLDKPFLFNLPNDSALPDAGQTLRVVHPKLPDCDKLRAGQNTEAQNLPEELADNYEGWSMFRVVTERIEDRVVFADKPTRCLQTRAVIYSDLFRSQFFEYLNNALRLDFGPSLSRASLGVPVTELIGDRLPNSLKLGIMATLFGFLIGIPAGVIAALRRNKLPDYTVTFVAVFIDSVPTLVMAPLLIIFFVVTLGWLPGPSPVPWRDAPVYSWEFISRAILPVMVLGTGLAAGLARLTRASVLQVLRDDYVRTARAKGLQERSVIYLHALKNALIPVVTIIGPLLAGLVTGSLITERIFAVPGIGDQFLNGVSARDYNLLLGSTILYSVFLIGGNVLVDIMYTWLDPRIRFD